MTAKKEKLLNKAYEKFMKISMNKLPPEMLKELVAENIMGYGTAIDEKINSFEDCRDLVDTQKEQSAGLKFKNEIFQGFRNISPEEDSAIFVDEMKVTIKTRGGTAELFLRITTILEYSNNKWRVVHFHTSKPDDTKGETDTWHIDEWKRKNDELQKIVDEKTSDLILKNRDLEIESSLERVRTVSMSMKKHEDLLDICEKLYKELQNLGFSELRNTMINIFKDDKETFLNYDYSDVIGKSITPLFYDIHPVIKKQVNQVRKSKDAYTETVFSIKDLADWKKFRKSRGEKDDPRIKKAKALHYYFYSVGKAAIGISTFSPIPDEKKQILKRFRNVFDFAYRRYLDVSQSEAQAREAKIEIALERVRSRTMAMQKSDELSETTFVLFKQFMDLGEAPDQITIGVINKEEKVIEFWTTMEGKKVDQMVKFPIKETNLMRKIHAAWKKQNKSLALEIKGKELHDYIDYRIRLTGVKTKNDHVYDRRFIQAAFFSKGMITISTNDPRSEETIQLLERFAGVFDLTYTRFLDLKQAEAQTKEAKIELALERVRARSMAMHHSSELVDASVVLFNELKLLGIEAIRTGVGIVDEPNKTAEVWSSQLIEKERNKILGVVPFEAHPFFEGYYKSWKKGDLYFSYELSGKEVKKYYNLMSSILSYPKMKVFNKRELFYTFFFPEGSLNVVSKDCLTADECNLMVRFAKVFGMIYTRFLDLQKAEAQAREAQIEVALERVRSRTMAMHKSEELAETAAVLFQQLSGLGIDALRLYIGIIEDESGEIDFWTTDYGGSQISSKYKASLFGSSTFKKIYTAWKENKKSIVVDPKGKELTEHLYYLKEIMNYPIRDRKTLSRRLQTIAYFSKGLIGVLSNDELPKKSIILLERFAGVFDLTYRRFIDLQKAEKQAREAQIETALERVRSRTMGMQKSEELGEVCRVMNEQLQQLNFKNYIAGFIMDYKNSDDFEIWRSDPSQLLMCKTHIPYFDHPIFKEYIKAKEKFLDFNTLILTFEEKNKWVDYVLPYFPALPQEIIDALYSGVGYAISVAFMKNVGVYIENFDGIPFSEDENAILIRFGKVFEQTYTRFLDLQKAESQAREAQIEVALERVRSRTMAMHSSDELQDAAVLLFQQIRDLGVNTGSCGYIIWDKVKKVATAWMSSPEGEIQEAFTLPHTKSKIYKEIYSAKELGKDFFVKEVGGNDLKNHFDYLTTVPGIGEKIKQLRKARYKFPEKIVYNSAFFKQGYLSFHTHELSPEAHDIFRRFANVFEQTYTRFLDLQKAEAQARESQIEAALERVRSRTMGMQKSEELRDVIKVVYEQFVHLNIFIEHTGFVMDYKKRDDYDIWVADKIGDIAHVTIPYFDSIYYNSFNEAKEKGKDFFVTNLNFKEKNIFYKKLFKNIPGLEEEAKKFYFNCSGLAISTVLLDNVSLYIENFSGIPYTDEENKTLMRFGKVFQQTYTRFLDLQKAEAQAREAKIETSLERVRARTMAMQKSEELDETVDVLQQQLNYLGIPAHSSFIGVVDNLESLNNARSIGEVSNIQYLKENPSDSTVDQMDKVDKVSKPSSPKDVTFDFYGAGKDQIPSWVMNGTNLKQLLTGLKNKNKSMILNTLQGEFDYLAYFSNGFIGVTSRIEFSADILNLLERFAGVFDLTYTRFLDLKKAEAQAREAKIETGLERVRARTMAMHNSDDVGLAIAALFTELEKLGIENLRCGIANIHRDKTMNVWSVSNVTEGKTVKGSGSFDMNLHPLWQNIYGVWEKKEEFFYHHLAGKEKQDYVKILNSTPDYLSQPIKQFPDMNFQSYHFGEGAIWTFSLIPHSEDDKKVMNRFTSVFSLTFRRYQDLQKAEAQTREAQIEAALEKVRGKAMAMHNSDNLTEAAGQVFTELNNLGIKPIRSGFVLLTKDSRVAKLYPATSFDNKNTVSFTGEAEFTGHPEFEKQYEIWQKKENYFPVLEGESLKSYYKEISKILSVPFKNFPTNKKQFGVFLPFTEGFLFSWSEELYSDKEINILERFKTILDLTIRRYLDLKNAEAQSRESQIEASLERVRSKAMAMQTSDDLSTAVSAIFEELEKLDLGAMRCGIGIINKEKKSVDVWASAVTDGQKIIELSGDESMDSHPLLKGAFDAWLRQEDFSYMLYGDDLINYYEVMAGSNLQIPDTRLHRDGKQKQYYHVSVFQAGGLFAFRETEFPGEAKIVMKRFAEVINFTYTRFNDLKQAEAQAKEAKLEAALERVRAGALIMRKPEDMLDVCKVISEQLILLNVNEIRNTQTAILNEGKESYQNYEYFPDYNESTISEIDYNLHPKVTEFVNEIKKSSDAFFMTVFEGKELVEWRDYRNSTNQKRDPKLERAISLHYYFFSIGPGALGISTYVPLNEDQINIFKRFRNVFELAYRRFTDIEQADAQAREAQIEASLERVRSRTLAMQKSDELAETAAVVFKQLINLGIEPNRLYIGIVNDNSGDIEAWATDEDGSKVSKEFTLNINANASVKRMYDGWVFKKKSVIIDMQGKELEAYLHYLHDVLEVPFKGGLSQNRRVQNIAYFSKGFIGIASPDPQPEETAILLERFAAVFNLTFTRFNDLQIAEKHAVQAELDLIKLQTEKNRAEEALTELRSTQAQLIQSEKMASLGELTAGIAHEIQNPLNFVNNFSEVNAELIDELNQEIEKGNFDEAALIAKDIKDNEEKIKHHGKRAEAIVKGMLQHSRSSTGVKESVNINALADEYLRLAFHGLRAKDKSFNAKMETDFDKSIGEINIVPQEIGRVILNLITNAFYVVDEKMKSGIINYEPKVSVSTKKNGDNIEVRVKDNGNGIPQKVLDKIFQPFFTTKPTGQGTGLGLSLSYDIVKAHGGEIEVATKENEGTTFTVYLLKT